MSVVGGRPKRHASPDYKVTKHIERTFLISDHYYYYSIKVLSFVSRFDHIFLVFFRR